MSYEPTLIIKYADFEKHFDELEIYYNKDFKNDYTDENRVMMYLRELYKSCINTEHRGFVQIDDMKLVICQPELTGFNKLVREKLDEWNIQYDVSN